MIAEDFLDRGTPWKLDAEHRLSASERTQINKRLMHISYERPVGSRGAYDIQGIRTRLLAAVQLFVDTAPNDRLVESLVDSFPGGLYSQFQPADVCLDDLDEDDGGM
jgi:hypothetical protein